MADLTNYAEGQLVTAVPDTLYAQLHTGDPGEDATQNVAAENTRKSVTFGGHSGGTRTAQADVLWENVAATEIYSHLSLWSAAEAGDPWYKGDLDAPKSVTAGDDFKLPAADFTIGLD